MTTKEWIDEYFKEQWVDINDCNINFEELKPISTSTSLHIFEERYSIDDKQYRLLYGISDDSNTPIIQILNT